AGPTACNYRDETLASRRIGHCAQLRQANRSITGVVAFDGKAVFFANRVYKTAFRFTLWLAGILKLRPEPQARMRHRQFKEVRLWGRRTFASFAHGSLERTRRCLAVADTADWISGPLQASL